MANTVKTSIKPSSNEINSNKEFGELLKYKRTLSGKTLIEVSELLNISDKTLSKLENGSIGSRLSTALYVAKMYGIKIGEIDGSI